MVVIENAALVGWPKSRSPVSAPRTPAELGGSAGSLSDRRPGHRDSSINLLRRNIPAQSITGIPSAAARFFNSAKQTNVNSI